MGRVSGITLYFDDRAENAEAGKRFGFQSVLVKAESSGRASGMARNYQELIIIK